MNIEYSPKFRRLYKKLPDQIKSLIEEKEDIFFKDPFDSRLRTHKLTGVLDGYWAFSIDYKHRAIFKFAGKDKILMVAIGDHSIYR